MNLNSNRKEDSYAMRMFKDSLRLYFAPLVGAIKGSIRAVKAEMKRAERERDRLNR